MARFEGWRRAAAVGALALAALPAGGCTDLDYALQKVPFFAFMHESPAFDPYEAPRPSPVGAVPMASPGAIGAAYPPIRPTEASLVAFGARYSNPVPPTEASIEAGRLYYDRYCAVCHGPVGRGDGPVIGQGKFPFAPDLTIPTTVQRTDGYLYAIIAAGRGLMPSYKRIQPVERWHIVNYIRYLQQNPGAAAAQPTAAPAAAAEGEE